MALTNDRIKERLIEKFAEQVSNFEEPYDMLSFEVPKEMNLKLLQFLFDDDELKFVDIRKAGAHKFIRKWITHYQNITNRIKNGFDGLNIKFVEAKSLWYSSEILFQRTPRGLDLLSYLKANTNITSIKVHFASFGLEPENLDYRYEMDLIFQFYEGSGAPSSYLTLATPEIKKYIQLLKKELPTKDKETQEKMQKDIQALSQYADTAIPCPPAKCPN